MAKKKRRKIESEKPNRSQINTSPKHTKQNQKVEPTVPFDVEDRILLVGEGDFSFAKSIVEHHGCYDVTATCLDSREDLLAKYEPQGLEHVSFLESEDQTVLYGVDATKLDATKALKKRGLFDRIIFNFPHVGGKTKDVNRQVRYNQDLLVQFFSTTINILTPHGTIVVTLFEGEPYTLWNIKDLARHSGLAVQRSFKFHSTAYPGYAHSRTLGNIAGGGGWKGEDRDARSYVFHRKGEQGSSVGSEAKRKKRQRDEASSDEDG